MIRNYKFLHNLKLLPFRDEYFWFSTQILSRSCHNSLKSIKGSNFIVFCNTQITKNGRNGNIEEAESIFNRMPHRNSISWTALLTAYSETGQVGKARKTFDEMPEPTIASYNAMITAYMHNNCNVEEAYKLFLKMGKRNAVSYAAMISGFIRAGMFKKAEKLYSGTPIGFRDPVCSNALINGYVKIDRLDEAIQIFEDMVERDVVSWSSMIDGLSKNGRILDARILFDKMPQRNVVSWTTMIDGYMEKGYFEDGFGLFLNMRREGVVGVNSTTITAIFKACGNYGKTKEGTQIHGLVLRMGFELDIVLANSLITMYCCFGNTNAAKQIFCNMSKKDVVSWNSLLCGYVSNSEVDAAQRIFERMPVKDLISWTAMITGFSMEGRTEKAIDLFDMMPRRDDISWTAVISGLLFNEEHEEAFRWFIQMLREGYRPNPITLSSILSAAADLAVLNQGLQIHVHVLKMDLEYDLSIQNSLISMYSKCGNIINAEKIFKDMKSPNIVSYNSIITGFAQNGFGKEALTIYKQMQNEGLVPNHITFLAILSACTHGGLVKEGWGYLNSMKSLYQIEPGVDHYACMVDLLGRAGLLDEAINLISSMPMKPHCGVWGALLGASRSHLRLDLAELAVQHLAKLEPANATPYVILSSLYSATGKETKKNQIRLEKNLKRIKKSPGCSWIVVNDKVNIFLSGDHSHMDIEEIKATILIMVKDLLWVDYLL